MKVLLAVFLILSLGGCSAYQAEEIISDTPIKQLESEESRQSHIIVDYGDKQATYSSQLTAEISVLDFLNQAANNQGWVVELVSYDFGDLVVGIDGFSNTSEKAWIYFVNGNSGDVGAGEKIVKPGDLVEWKYLTPSF